MIKFYIKLVKLIMKRSNIHVKKELLIGSSVSILLMVIYSFEYLWANLVVLFYMYLLQITCVFRNAVYLDAQDLKLFGLNKNTLRFRITYLLQRYFNDLFIANTLIILSVIIFLFTKQFLLALHFILIISASFWIMPNLNFLSIKREINTVVYVLGLTFLYFALFFCAIIDVFSVRLILSGESWNGLIIIGSGMLVFNGLIYGFTLVGKRSRQSTGLIRGALLWLKRFKYTLFKDYLLQNFSVFFNILMLFSLGTLLLPGTPKELIPVLVVFIVAGTSLFTAKSKKQYRLLKEDKLFDESVLKLDRQILRKNKWLTVMSGVVIKLLIAITTLVVTDTASNYSVVSTILIMLISSSMEFNSIYLNQRVSSIQFKVILYSTILLFGITYYIESYYGISMIYMVIVLAYTYLFIRKILLQGENSNVKVHG